MRVWTFQLYWQIWRTCIGCWCRIRDWNALKVQYIFAVRTAQAHVACILDAYIVIITYKNSSKANRYDKCTDNEKKTKHPMHKLSFFDFEYICIWSCQIDIYIFLSKYYFEIVDGCVLINDHNMYSRAFCILRYGNCISNE